MIYRLARILRARAIHPRGGRRGVSKVRARRIPLLVSVLVVVAGMIVASPAAWAVLVKAAVWQMNEPSGQMMIDSSGNFNNGTPTDVLQTGSTYVFIGSTSRVVVPDSD